MGYYSIVAVEASDLERLTVTMRVAEEGFDPFTEMPYDQLLGYLDDLFEDDERARISSQLSQIEPPESRRTVVNALIFTKLVQRGMATEVAFREVIGDTEII